MKAYHVSRRFGWDTHGLPIEYEIDKRLKMSARDAVKSMGIEKYNAECRAIVLTYSAEWRHTIERLGRWIDFDNDYKSMDLRFMESCWWIMPYSTELCTPLSHMESKQNEKMTQDPAILVSVPMLGVEGREDTSFVVYTTTPWTLPSNTLIAVHPDFEYLEILDEKTSRRYILLESGLSLLYKDLKKARYTVLDKIPGKAMIGWKYKLLFHYFSDTFSDCFQVIAAAYVEADEGTGLVHQAPAFGQEDYDAAVAAGFISPSRLPPCPVDEAGSFTTEVADYVGQHVKTADKAILKDLRSTGRLLVESQVSHVDKFCWRSDTQLVRRAVSSWFIRVTDWIPEMLANLEKTTWVSQFVKVKQFANWVSNAHDWNVSRNRYWGAPIPLWGSSDYEEVVCVGSVEELKRLSGFDGSLDDIHRDKVDGITIPSMKGKGVLRRLMWSRFESGSMPYASIHHRFENSGQFHNGLFPADFIAEGLDQTRGWFYTLTVLGNKLFKTSPFKNVIVNGIVLDEYGRKMSKSLQNHPDPDLILDQYGSDALRLYLINSPVVRAEPMCFKESGIKQIVAKVLLPLGNSYRFFQKQELLFKKLTGQDVVIHTSFDKNSGLGNVMDRWILADCQSLLRFVEEEIRGYRLYTVVPRLLQAIDNLTNWYIRFNRKRLKGAAGLGLDDTTAALNTLLQVLFTMIRALAPFIPFLTKHIYQLLRPHLAPATAHLPNARIVHFLPFPTVQHALFDPVVERRVAAKQRVIQLGRAARERRGMSLKTPLLSFVVIADAQPLADVGSLAACVREELNVRDVVLTTEDDDEAAQRYGVRLEARVDWPSLGRRLKKDVQVVRRGLPALGQERLREYQRTGRIEVEGVVLGEGDLMLVRVIGEGKEQEGAGEDEEGRVAAFADDMVEGLVRDLINRFQRLRKKAGLVPTDEWACGSVVATRQDMFVAALRGRVEEAREDEGEVVLEEEQAVGNLVVMLQLARV
ncbi:putative Isoleucyl-tRNA synthetase [Parathielavia hyrcaniae]|uniref:isoleucine--tRNA ligase n=1 Tax=Parathielavia hyrcaniae TaxID=113614 RepID=A0AAN6PR96_9PEZI|nr:putative Isoleucyl-tRNA synthetase [Parathielavia hyrcaniae]